MRFFLLLLFYYNLSLKCQMHMDPVDNLDTIIWYKTFLLLWIKWWYFINLNLTSHRHSNFLFYTIKMSMSLSIIKFLDFQLDLVSVVPKLEIAHALLTHRVLNKLSTLLNRNEIIVFHTHFFHHCWNWNIITSFARLISFYEVDCNKVFKLIIVLYILLYTSWKIALSSNLLFRF